MILAGGRTPFLLREVKDVSHQREVQSSDQEPQEPPSMPSADEEPWAAFEDEVLGTGRFWVKSHEDSAKRWPRDWSVVGDCYVHGIMRGEWFQKNPRRFFASIRIH